MQTIRYFTCFAAAAAAAGWIASALGALHGAVYAALLAGVFFALLWSTASPDLIPRSRVARFKLARFLRPLPLVFAAVFAACALGGLWHAPNNYDYLNYRLPRVLHWLHESAWHWIETPNQRLNCSGANSEWLILPSLLLTGEDRWAFLANLLCFGLMPAGLFAAISGMGIRLKAAWCAMWAIPTAYCFVSQAASTGSDLTGAAFFVFAIALICHARRTKENGWLLSSVLAIAFCTGIKATNIPLVLPWLALAWPTLVSSLRTMTARTVTVAITSVLCSFAPLAALNLHYTGYWKGQLEEQASLEAGTSAAGLIGNSLAIMSGALQPPLLPQPELPNRIINEVVPPTVDQLLARDFPRLQLKFFELPNEENAGIGLGLTLLSVSTIIAGLYAGLRQRIMSPLGWRAVLFAGVSLLTYMSLSASESAARLLSPYYVLLLALPFGVAGASKLYTLAWWRALVVCCTASAIPIPLLTPSRPLIPVATLAAQLPLSDRLKQRLNDVYAVYSTRSDNLGAFRKVLPSKAHRVGMIATGDDIEVSLWRPFDSGRSVHHVDPDSISLEKSDALLVSSLALRQRHHIEPEIFLSDLDQSPEWAIAGSLEIVSKVQEGPVKWTLLLREDLPSHETFEQATPSSPPAN